ncbi:conserved hypothetical protein [Gammaproteobacteria bacterium]
MTTCLHPVSLFILIGAFFFVAQIPAGSAAFFPGLDPSLEQAWAEQVTTRLRVGEVVWFPSPLGKFLALYTKAIGLGQNHGAVILFPSPDSHPDSDPISTLRIALPRHGWHTLAVQLPTMLAESSPSEYAHVLPAACDRLRVAITWLYERQIINVVVLGHGLGAAVAAACVVAIGDNTTLRGLIFLGVGGTTRIAPLPAALDPAVSLEKITLPILDIYGEYDLPAARMGARIRETGRRERKQGYVQILLPGANHRLTGIEEVVVGRIAGWLRHYASEKNRRQ